MAEKEAWFVYRKAPGKFSAKPTNAKGWAAFVACLVAIQIVAALVLPAALRVHPIWGFAVLPVIILAGLLAILKLAVAKGRPAP